MEQRQPAKAGGRAREGSTGAKRPRRSAGGRHGRERAGAEAGAMLGCHEGSRVEDPWGTHGSGKAAGHTGETGSKDAPRGAVSPVGLEAPGGPGITLCASLLAGGYERFSSEYPEFCAKTKSLSNVSPPTSAEPLDLGCSSCGTPLHDQDEEGGRAEMGLNSSERHPRLPLLRARDQVPDCVFKAANKKPSQSSDCPNHFEGHYQYKCIPVEDNHKADISSWFMEAIEYIDSVKECCGRVLVHCQAGISRSATICLAYLMMKKRVKLEEAFEFVKQRRSIISPNFSFMGQLLQFESQVLATSCAVEAVSPSGTLRERGKATSTPTSQFVFSFPVSVGVHATPSSLPYLHSPITTSPSC
ncbi:PREDICTED: dual specificity protein phosphatase 4 [Charadrius vociferus]|uniref:dual specificity protein phosphatase 4 n=1 Tax=Charadrius vociferus TaxID=50402 RepID=UPI0005211FB0|nr:PREDICTED: dual specificity protein phosphatase 4 [Charadrius vociferus]